MCYNTIIKHKLPIEVLPKKIQKEYEYFERIYLSKEIYDAPANIYNFSYDEVESQEFARERMIRKATEFFTFIIETHLEHSGLSSAHISPSELRILVAKKLGKL